MIRTSQKYLDKEFQTTVDPEMVRVDGRVLPPPKIKLGPQDQALVPRDGSWDMRDKALHQGADINTWALACFTPSHRCNETQLRNFCRQMATVSNKEGMKMAPETVKVSYARSGEVNVIYYCCCPQTSLENLENLDCERPHILIRDRRASEINLDPGPLLRMTAKVCSASTAGRKWSEINDRV